MTPKKKAKDLTILFFNTINKELFYGFYGKVRLEEWETAKELALVFVNEILNNALISEWSQLKYWQEVKREIEKL